jgi:multicomponent Na+:H+ antiporter subunit E
MRRLPAIVLLTAVYCLAVGSFRPLDLVVGAVVALVAIQLLGVARDPVSLGSFIRRAAAFPAFAFALAREVVVGSVQVALMVVGARSREDAGVVSVPIGERTRSGVAVSAFALTLSPGEVLVKIDWDMGRMLVHTVDARDPDGLRARYLRLYERYQRPLFP